MLNINLNTQYNVSVSFELLPDDNEYTFDLSEKSDSARECTTYDFTLKRNGNTKFKVVNYTISALIKCVDIYNVSPRFMGYAHVSHQNPAVIISTATSKDFPYVTYGSNNGENRFTIGLKNQITETEMLRTGKGGHMYYDSNIIRFRRPVGGVELYKHEISDGIFISDAKKSWFDVSKDYWNYIDTGRNYIPNPTPPSAYGPNWCSWLYLTDIDEDKIYKTALEAKELGIKTLVIDAGWFCHDTDIPFPDSPLTKDTINYGRVDADKSKFPDMRGLVDRIHAMGLYVWAWATPRWIFRAIEEGEGAVDKRLLDLRIRTKGGELAPLLCTRCPETWDHAAKFTSYLLEKYDFDGLKFDCWELDDNMAVCTSNSHTHETDTMGEGTMEWCRHIYNAMTAAKKDAVVWFNNTTAKQFGNYSTSPNEIYCQPDENWRMGTLLKSFTNGIISQVSEGSFHHDEYDENIARHLIILMMGHVPELQVDLTTLTPPQRKLIKNWFEFYEEHKYKLIRGEYIPFGFKYSSGGPISTSPLHVKIISGDTAYIFVGNLRLETVELSEDIKKIYVFNLQSENGVEIGFKGISQRLGNIKLSNYFTEETDSYKTDISENKKIYLDLCIGGFAVIE